MNAPRLISELQTWQHFIGGYYADVSRFVTEAKKIGISRRAPAQAVRGMNFGDRLLLLRWNRPDVFAFAEASISGMTLDHEIADAVGKELEEKGLATYEGAGGGTGLNIERDCGSYCVCGTWTVRCSWGDVVNIALQIAQARGETLFLMINARLTAAYKDPVYLQPVPKFTRGFTRVSVDTSYQVSDSELLNGSVFAIRDYQKRQKRPAAPAPV